ncbi:hypothetical protein C8Q77DRAFT_1156572 [Trametes polyzona]|nr:hypothetical protein C8Q77DRAFT_1156572 [Trametes polyzona]
MTAQVSFADLSLFPATPEQVRESQTRTAVQWAKGLSLEDYLRRDAILDKYEHATDGKLITWVLAPRNDPTTLDFMCSCETYRRTAAIAKRAKEVDAREVREVTAYGVASVFTPASKRGKGYARHMMRLLHWVLAPRSALPDFPAEWGTAPDVDLLRSLGVANAQFSVLYSDVGRNFYQAAGLSPGSNDGWVVEGVLTTTKAVDASDKSTSSPHGLNIHQLTEEDVIALYDRDATWLKDDLSRLAGDTDRTLFSFLPNRGVGAFVIRRLMQPSSSTQGGTLALPATHWGVAIFPPGVRHPKAALQNQVDPIPFATWTLELKESPRKLVVARLRADEHTFPVLLDELLSAARELKVERVDFWYLPPTLRALANERGWTSKERDEHLSAVKWYGEERADEIEWVFNEKFCWC